MTVNNNLLAANSAELQKSQRSRLQESAQKLSSGYRINSAADDAAGLAISEKLQARITGQSKAMSNVQDGISFVGVGDGALSEVHNMLNRMRELAVQGSNGILSDDDRGIIQQEMDSLLSEIDRIAQSTNFNGKNLLDGSMDASAGGEAMKFQIGDTAAAFDKLEVNIASSTSEALGLSGLSTASAADSMSALGSIRNAIDKVSSNRGSLGAAENRLNHAYNSLSVANENTMASNSRIKNTDIAKEMMEFTKQNILSQTRNAMLSQSNMQAAQVLQLLR